MWPLAVDTIVITGPKSPKLPQRAQWHGLLVPWWIFEIQLTIRLLAFHLSSWAKSCVGLAIDTALSLWFHLITAQAVINLSVALLWPQTSYLNGTSSSHSASAAEPPASLSASLFNKATVAISATLVLSHTQFWLQEQHQLSLVVIWVQI